MSFLKSWLHTTDIHKRSKKKFLVLHIFMLYITSCIKSSVNSPNFFVAISREELKHGSCILCPPLKRTFFKYVALKDFFPILSSSQVPFMLKTPLILSSVISVALLIFWLRRGKEFTPSTFFLITQWKWCLIRSIKKFFAVILAFENLSLCSYGWRFGCESVICYVCLF